MAVALYSADQVNIVWGPIKFDGFGPDTFVKVERNEDSFTPKVGADGEVARTRNLNRTGKVTVTLMQTSSTNPLLQAAIIADEATANGVAIFPLMVKDNSGNALWSAKEAWLTRPASTEGAREVGTREWVLECAQLNSPIPFKA